MPVHKRPRGTVTPPPSPPPPLEVEDDADGSAENDDGEQPDDASDSDGSSYSSGGEEDEFIVVKLGEIRKEVQCPICLGVIRKTRTVMECLHRFCRECIDKSMRLGNNECPACRTHCASRRSLRDDPNYDALIAALYPDIDKFEEEELAFLEEEKARNKQIQASIAQTFRRQAEALGKKPRAVTPTSLRRQGNYRNLRARRNHRVVEHNDSDEEEEVNGHDNSSSSDEHSAEVKSKRYRKWGRARSSQPSSGANASGGCDDNNDPEGTRDLVGTSSAGPISSTDFLGWGRGGLRSNLRHGGANLANSRLSRNNRLSKLINYLQSSNENDELKINLMIVSLHEDKIPCLKRPHLCCSPTTSVGQLCQYVAMQTSVGASEMEMLIVNDSLPVKYSSSPPTESANYNPSNHELQLLDEHQTLGQIHTQFYEQNLVFAYRLKGQGEGN